jgi:hypothetical protein
VAAIAHGHGVNRYAIGMQNMHREMKYEGIIQVLCNTSFGLRFTVPELT